MRRPIALIALATVSLFVVGATAGADDARDAIRGATRVVMAQLEAFRRDDFTAAYRFASPMIRELFDPEHFEAMVRGGYPEIARSAGAVVSRAELTPNDTVYLTLRIQGANGQTIEATYELVRDAGDWRINGVVTRPAPGIVKGPAVQRPARASSAMQPSSRARSAAPSVAPPNRVRS